MTPPDEILDLLTAYALDALEPEEIARVDSLLEQHPEWHQTLAELRATAALLPYGLPQAEPPPSLRRRTLDHATGRAPRLPLQRPAAPLRRWLLALGGLAAVALLAAGLAWAQLGAAQTELARTQADLATARAELTRAQADLAAAQSAQRRVAEVLALSEPLVTMSGPGGRGTVLRAPSGETLVAAQLPQLAQGRVYQLWLIQGSGAPVSGGTFTVDEQGFGLLRLGTTALSPLAADTFAITDEPAGGSPGPTTTPLVAGQQSAT
ncbi:MAG TPA: anti-sigma factor [Roseiflexaceae bacterium]|nr:anti-sigma factor [Roseiflexaceae bacterium]